MNKSVFSLASLTLLVMSDLSLFASPQERIHEVDTLLGPDTVYYHALFPTPLPNKEKLEDHPYPMVTMGIDAITVKNKKLTKEPGIWTLPSDNEHETPYLFFEEAPLIEAFKDFLFEKKTFSLVPFSLKGTTGNLEITHTTLRDALAAPHPTPSFERAFSISGTFQEKQNAPQTRVSIDFKWSTSDSDEPGETPQYQTKGLIYHLSKPLAPSNKAMTLTAYLFCTKGPEHHGLLELASTWVAEGEVTLSEPTDIIYLDTAREPHYPFSVRNETYSGIIPREWSQLWHPKEWIFWNAQCDVSWNEIISRTHWNTFEKMPSPFEIEKVIPRDSLPVLPHSEVEPCNLLGYYKRKLTHILPDSQLFIQEDGSYTLRSRRLETWHSADLLEQAPLTVIVSEDSGIPVKLTEGLSLDVVLGDEFEIVDFLDGQTPPASQGHPTASAEAQIKQPPWITIYQAKTGFQSDPKRSPLLEEEEIFEPTITIDAQVVRKILSPTNLFLDIIATSLSLADLSTLKVHGVGLYQLTPQKLAAFASELKRSAVTNLAITHCFPKQRTDQQVLNRFLVQLLSNSKLGIFLFDGNYMSSETFNTFAPLVSNSNLTRVSFRLPDEGTYIPRGMGAGVAVVGVLAYTGVTVASGGATLAVGGAAALFGSTVAAPVGEGATESLKRLTHKLTSLIHSARALPNGWVLNCLSRFSFTQSDSARTLAVYNNPEPSTDLYTIEALKDLYPTLEVLFKNP